MLWGNFGLKQKWFTAFIALSITGLYTLCANAVCVYSPYYVPAATCCNRDFFVKTQTLIRL